MNRPVGVHRNVGFNRFFRDWYYEWITKKISSNKIKTVLDVGAGDGRFSVWAKKKWFDVVSIDLEPKEDWILNSDFVKTDYEKPFDLVYCSHVLEHQQNHLEFAEHLEKVTGKYLVVICPLPNRVFWDEPTHYRPYNAETLRRTFLNLKPVFLKEINVPGFITSAIGVFEVRK